MGMVQLHVRSSDLIGDENSLGLSIYNTSIQLHSAKFKIEISF